MDDVKDYKEEFYLFVFEDSIYEMNCGVSLADAIWEMSKYTDSVRDAELFRKSIFALDEKTTSVDEYIQLYNVFSSGFNNIEKIYIVDKVLYDKKAKKKSI